MNLAGALVGLVVVVSLGYVGVYLGLCVAAIRAERDDDEERSQALRMRAFRLRLGVRALLVAALFVTLAMALL